VLARLHDRWLLGRDAEQHRPRWSVLRDLLGWRDAGADTPLPAGPDTGRGGALTTPTTRIGPSKSEPPGTLRTPGGSPGR